jgi:RNA polymerase sigma factor (sigma-70 family)
MNGDDSDTALVLAARDGDKDAFCGLLDRHRPTLIALCRRAVGDHELAEDAAQEAVLQALLSLDQLRRPDRFGAWLAGIGLNICRRWLRDRSHDCWSWEAVQGGRLASEPPDWQAGPEELVEAADLADRVRLAVADLPRGQRAAVVLFYLSGLTYAETAALLGVEVSAVKTRLHKARRALRRQLWAARRDEEMTTELGTQPVDVRIADVRRQPADGDRPGYHMLVLEEVDGTRRLPVWIGPFEGTAIALHLEKVQVPRPLTFTFVASLVQASGGRLLEVRISRLVEDTFHAVAVIEEAGGTKTVDARPSDALALALVAGAPMRVEPAVFEAVEAQKAARAYPREAEWYREGSKGAGEIVAEVTANWPAYRSRSSQPS